MFRFPVGKLGETFKYIRVNIYQSPCDIILDQQDYIDSLNLTSVNNSRSNMKNDPLTSSEHTVFHDLVGQLKCVVQGTQPDIAFDTVNLSTKFKHTTINVFAEDLKSI